MPGGTLSEPGFSDCSHRDLRRAPAWSVQIPPRARSPVPTGLRPFWGAPRRLPADALAQLGRLALFLAAVEGLLEERQQRDEHREGDDQAEAEERDDAVVGLSDETLAVVARQRGGGEQQPSREGNEGDPTHASGTIPGPAYGHHGRGRQQRERRAQRPSGRELARV